MSADARTDFLAGMAAASTQRVRVARQREGDTQIYARARAARFAPKLVVAPTGFDLIAEFKPRSPSAGTLVHGERADPAAAAAAAAAYSEAGALAVSVLTEPASFGGSLAHLKSAARVSAVPVLRKDFLVDPYQVMEARAAGAGGVLLMVRLVDDPVFDALRAAADELGLFALLEAFDRVDLARIAASLLRLPAREPVLVGVNSRDLSTLAVDSTRLRDLVTSIPAGTLRVAESGLATAGDAAAVARVGYRLALVGTALMRASDPAAQIRELLRAGRAAAGAGAGAGT